MRERERKACSEERQGGKGRAQTFRRGRAVMFYQQLETKHKTIKRQLESAEFEAIRPILLGELKAIEMVMEEFKVLFNLED